MVRIRHQKKKKASGLPAFPFFLDVQSVTLNVLFHIIPLLHGLTLNRTVQTLPCSSARLIPASTVCSFSPGSCLPVDPSWCCLTSLTEVPTCHWVSVSFLATCTTEPEVLNVYTKTSSMVHPQEGFPLFPTFLPGARSCWETLLSI